MAADQTMGQFVLESIVMENAATPFLDLQVPPGLDWKDFVGVADWGLKDAPTPLNKSRYLATLLTAIL